MIHKIIVIPHSRQPALWKTPTYTLAPDPIRIIPVFFKTYAVSAK